MPLFSMTLRVRGRDKILRYGRASATLDGGIDGVGATRLSLQADIPIAPTDHERIDTSRLQARLTPLLRLAAELIDAELETNSPEKQPVR